MKKKCVGIGISLLFISIAVAPTINFNTVNAFTNDNYEEGISQKKILFQTIIDISNNKEIKGIVLRYQISKGIHTVLNSSVLTMKQLKQMYFIGLILSKTISKARIQSMIQTHQFITPETQQEINNVIEKNATLKNEITRLSSLGCSCENENSTYGISKNFICILFTPLAVFFYWCVFVLGYEPNFILTLLGIIDDIFNCWWFGWHS